MNLNFCQAIFYLQAARAADRKAKGAPLPDLAE